MAVNAGDLIEITMRTKFWDQETDNVWQYEASEASISAPAVGVAEAWWNHVKASYRGAVLPAGGRQFFSVLLRTLNDPTGDLVEWPVPVAESTGTRSVTSPGDFLPSFMAVGVRLAVGSRATKPGQKRFSFMAEADINGQYLTADILTDVGALMTTMTGAFLLGAPAVGTLLDPIVTRKDATGAVTAHQVITGFVINPQVTTQNSRKLGRGG